MQKPPKPNKLAQWVSKRYEGFTPEGKLWLTIGLACLVVDMAIGFSAGYSVATFWHGVGYAALACGFAFLPDAAYEEFEQRRYISAVFFAILCVPIGIKAYEQQLTYSAGMRSGEMQAVGVANAKYDGAQDDVVRNRKELATLLALAEEIHKSDPWSATVTADGLREQIKTLEASIAAEGSAKNGGCKRRCLDLMNQKTAAEAKIATAEKLTLTNARIKQLQETIDRKRETANKTEYKTSLNVDVAKTTARLYKVVTGASPEDTMKDDDVAQNYATLGSAGLGSLAILILAPAGIFLAKRRRREVLEEPLHPVTRTVDANGNTIIHHHTERIVDDEGLRQFKERIKDWSYHPKVKGLIAT
jgi:hypothetical protein